MVDICTTLGHYIIEIIKVILILSVFLIATAIILAVQYKQYIWLLIMRNICRRLLGKKNCTHSS